MYKHVMPDLRMTLEAVLKRTNMPHVTLTEGMSMSSLNRVNHVNHHRDFKDVVSEKFRFVLHL